MRTEYAADASPATQFDDIDQVREYLTGIGTHQIFIDDVGDVFVSVRAVGADSMSYNALAFMNVHCLDFTVEPDWPIHAAPEGSTVTLTQRGNV